MYIMKVRNEYIHTIKRKVNDTHRLSTLSENGCTPGWNAPKQNLTLAHSFVISTVVIEKCYPLWQGQSPFRNHRICSTFELDEKTL